MKKLSILILLFSLNSYASFLIEPYAGVTLGGSWQAEGADDKDSFTGNMYGARAGVERMGFMVGLDGRMGTWNIDDSASSELAYTSYGLFAGYNFPMLLRVWGSYIIGGSGEVKDRGDHLAPSGFVLGVGYKVMPFVSINFESGSIKYTEFEASDGTNTEREDEGSYYLLSVSFPINIGL